MISLGYGVKTLICRRKVYVYTTETLTSLILGQQVTWERGPNIKLAVFEHMGEIRFLLSTREGSEGTQARMELPTCSPLPRTADLRNESV